MCYYRIIHRIGKLRFTPDSTVMKSVIADVERVYSDAQKKSTIVQLAQDNEMAQHYRGLYIPVTTPEQPVKECCFQVYVGLLTYSRARRIDVPNYDFIGTGTKLAVSLIRAQTRYLRTLRGVQSQCLSIVDTKIFSPIQKPMAVNVWIFFMM